LQLRLRNPASNQDSGQSVMTRSFQLWIMHLGVVASEGQMNMKI